MSFKISDLKNWTVERDIALTDSATIKVTIAIKKRSEFEAVANKGVDLDTAKFLVTGIAGMTGENDKELDLKAAWAEIADYPSMIMAITQTAIDAQYTAAVKN